MGFLYRAFFERMGIFIITMNGIFRLLLTIVEFILAFGFLVFLHELGHYLMSKLFNVEVEEFGFGFPPRLVKLFQFRETEVTLNWIPFGAFVRPKGENDPSLPGGLAAANPWARLGVLLGGPLMNILVGILLFSLLFANFGAPVLGKVLIAKVLPGTPAAAAGIEAGDLITQINDEPIINSSELSQVIGQNLGQEVTITFEHNGKTQRVSAVPRTNPPAGEGALGIEMGNPIRQVNWFEAVPVAAQMTYEQTKMFVELPVRLVQGRVSAQEGRFVGPVGIFNFFEEARQQDAQMAAAAPQEPPAPNTINLLAVISVALGLTNLLPIPALDGGRILFVLPEILFRRRVPAEYENVIHLIGFTVLILLMIYVTTQDILNPINLR